VAQVVECLPSKPLSSNFSTTITTKKQKNKKNKKKILKPKQKQTLLLKGNAQTKNHNSILIMISKTL
jgi:hypothetical protein